MTETLDAWPAGSTWVFQGTVAEDGTGGTHVCTLTVTPGAGNEMQLLYGQIKVGATATAQTASGTITDGTNDLSVFFNPQQVSGTTSGLTYPIAAVPNEGITSFVGMTQPLNLILSGTQQLILKVSTAAISVTQTFSVVCRLKTGQKPTAVLADSVGTPVLTTNTNQVF